MFHASSGASRAKIRQLFAIALRCDASETPAIAIRHCRNPAGDDEASGKSFDIPLEGRRQCLVEIIDVEDRGTFGRRVRTEIRQMAVTT